LSEVLCGDDPEAADRAMRSHIRYGLEEIIGAIVTGTQSRWRATGDGSTAKATPVA
jgi:hypothetical protein